MCIVIAAGHSGGLFFCAAGFSVSSFWLSLYHIKRKHTTPAIMEMMCFHFFIAFIAYTGLKQK